MKITRSQTLIEHYQLLVICFIPSDYPRLFLFVLGGHGNNCLQQMSVHVTLVATLLFDRNPHSLTDILNDDQTRTSDKFTIHWHTKKGQTTSSPYGKPGLLNQFKNETNQ